MREYVVGLMFDDNMEHVVLIKKQHGPKYVVGYWNGVGGHMEEGEAPIDAMMREFQEETGVRTFSTFWTQFTTLAGEGFRIYFFYGRDTDILQRTHTTTDEVVGTWAVRNIAIDDSRLVPNLLWMIAFLCDSGTMPVVPGPILCTNVDDK